MSNRTHSGGVIVVLRHPHHMLVWAWPASLSEIESLEDNMQLCRNDEYV